jgi:DNA topoisomerase-1
MIKMNQLMHNGIYISKLKHKQGLKVYVRDEPFKLTALQEQMAIAWVKKLETSYAEDTVFIHNFFEDFTKTFDIDPNIDYREFDFSEIITYLQEEKHKKESLSREEVKRLREERKKNRENLRERFGYASVDGERIPITNYVAEPSSIFVGRGNHPLRGRWKEGPRQSDITLNLSPNAPRPDGEWKETVWQPNVLWIAKWNDKLRGKEKYVWLSDTYIVKQEREIRKFDKAYELEKNIKPLRKHIVKNLISKVDKRRKIATVCYLIDKLCLRVGDEKEQDELNTVGATTLEPKHITFSEKNKVSFDFLGKDAVRWQKTVVLHPLVISNLKEFMESSSSTIFYGVRSDNVSQFLDEVAPGTSAKVFRTYHATNSVKKQLKENVTINEKADFIKKYVATMANLQAAKVCNHKRKLPKRWQSSLEKKQERLNKLQARNRSSVNKLKLEIKNYKAKKEKQLQSSLEKKQERLNKLQARNRNSIDKLKHQISAYKLTKDYNLRTSLKSYIDPRVYYTWCKKVDFDWKKYYPKALQEKFIWVEQMDN